MTDNLENKFSNTNQLLVTHHEELMTALDNLATGIGQIPRIDYTVFNDMKTVLDNIYSRLGTMQTENAAFYLATGLLLNSMSGKLDTLETIATGISTLNDTLNSMVGEYNPWLDTLNNSLVQIASNSELLINNGSTNTQYLLAAIVANDPCKCDQPPVYQLPEPGTTPTTVDTVHCQRMQALIYAFKRFVAKLDVLSSFGVGFSTSVISTAFTEVITELGVPSNLLMPTTLEISALVFAAVTYVASNVFAGNSLSAAWQQVEDDLLSPLYLASTATDGQQAYKDVINAADIPATIKNVLIAIGYSSAFNLYYGTEEIDLAGYDGTLCNDFGVDGGNGGNGGNGGGGGGVNTFVDEDFQDETFYLEYTGQPDYIVHVVITGDQFCMVTEVHPTTGAAENIQGPYDRSWTLEFTTTWKFYGNTPGHILVTWQQP